MKKVRLYFYALVLGTIVFCAGCKKERSILGCSSLAVKVSNAATDYSLNPSEATCRAYVNAVNDYYDGCALVPQSDKDQYDAVLEDGYCTVK